MLWFHDAIILARIPQFLQLSTPGNLHLYKEYSSCYLSIRNASFHQEVRLLPTLEKPTRETAEKANLPPPCLGRGGSSQGSVLVDDLLPFISFSPNEYQPPNAWQSQPQQSLCGDTIMRKLHSQMNFKYSSQQLNLQMSVFSLSIAGSPSVQRQIAANTKFASRKHKLFISGV